MCIDGSREGNPQSSLSTRSHRSADGGFHPQQGIDEMQLRDLSSSSALQDLGDLLSIRSEVVASRDGLRAGKLAWSNERAVAMPSTNATAAAPTTLPI